MNNTAARWLYQRTKQVHLKVFLNAVLNIVTSICTVLFALLMRDLIDAAVSRNLAGIKEYSVFIFLLTVCIYIAHVISHIMQESITVKTLSDLRAFLIMALMNKDYSEIQKKHSGQWMNLLFSDIKVISDGAASIIPSVAGMVSRLLFSFITLAVLEPVLAIIYLTGGILIMIAVGLFRGKLKALHRTVQEKEDRLHVFLQEVIENLLIIKVFGAQKHIGRKTGIVQQDYSDARMRRRKYRLISVNLFSFAFRMGYLAALIFGGYQLLKGSITYGTLTAILQIVNQMQTPIFSLSGILPRIYETIASTERIMVADTLKEEKVTDKCEIFNGLSAEHLEFAYDRDDVITNSSFEIQRNDIVAVTGISGGGKSTLFLLLLGIFNPAGGEIKIETDKGILNPGIETRNLFSYVPQGNGLFTGTIRENIIFHHFYDQKRFENALKTADAYEFVMELPEKEETSIGERGTGLSEGQIQRLAIARAVYNDAPVLLLDESTSALDEETEARVLENIKKLNNKTVLIVTHRPAALQICSRHLMIENGRITEAAYECH